MAQDFQTYLVSAPLAGERLDKALAALRPGLTRGQAQRLIESGDVLVGERPSKSAYRLRAGEIVAVSLQAVAALLAPPDVMPVAYPLDVLHEDDDLIVVNKPPGLVVHPAGPTETPSLVAALLHRCGRLADAGDPLRRGIVHRLDRDTSGAIVAAKTDGALAALAEQFRLRKVHKRYLAVVRGQPEPPEGEVALPIGRDRRVHDRMTVRTLDGRRAVTRYRTLERFTRHAFIEARPVTGRTHQIRVHLRAIGHPVLADGAYGGGGPIYASELRGARRGRDEPPVIARQALHAYELAFAHPRTGREMRFVAPEAPDFRALIAALRETTPHGPSHAGVETT